MKYKRTREQNKERPREFCLHLELVLQRIKKMKHKTARLVWEEHVAKQVCQLCACRIMGSFTLFHLITWGNPSCSITGRLQGTTCLITGWVTRRQLAFVSEKSFPSSSRASSANPQQSRPQQVGAVPRSTSTLVESSLFIWCQCTYTACKSVTMLEFNQLKTNSQASRPTSRSLN